ncbi:hypothetical protein LXN57_42070, partial [Actinoplanes sp. TRM88002]|nr:hypothetical protein [Actinoplanes hotanensis]
MSTLQALRQLLRQSHHARPEDLPEMAMRAADLIGAEAMIMYVVDHQQRELLPLLGGSVPHRDPIAVDGTLGGRAYALVTPCAGEVDGQPVRLWLALVNGSERMGVLEVVAPASLEDEAVDECVSVASLLAELLITRNLYSDDEAPWKSPGLLGESPHLVGLSLSVG